MITSASQYAAAYQSIAPDLPGQSLKWLQQLRSQAQAKFESRGFPSLREEEWRYTNVSAIEKKFFKPATQTPADIEYPEGLNSYKLDDVWTVVLVNGRFSAELSDLAGLPETVIVSSMAQALEDCPELVELYLGQAVSDDEHSFVAFNTAWFSDGIFVQIPPNERLTQPIQVLHVMTQANSMAVTRNIVAVQEMGEAQIIETYVGIEAYLSAAVTEVFVGQNADLKYYKLQCESDNAYHFGGLYAKQARDARFTHHNFALGGLVVRNDIHTDLYHASECELNGLYLGVKRQHIDNHTRINHLKPHAISREHYKGVLADRARGVFQGRVIVEKDAQKTDSEMNNRNLLLSDDAEVDTKPQLEIYADDVKCAHGVTVGQLDEKSVFYLQSRCVDEETARNMLTFAFANEMVDKIQIRSLHDLVLAQLLLRFPQEGINKEWL